MEDDAREKELWQTQGFYWTVELENNYMAELAALHKGIRSVPANVDLTIHTDSLSAKQAIESALRSPESFKALRCAGRPYILAIVSAIETRTKSGASTTLLHVRSHTGGRDKASIGNAKADRLAKWEASQPNLANSAINLLQNDLPFVLCTTEWTGPEGKKKAHETVKPVHGDVRGVAKTHLASLRLCEWGDPSKRPKYGELAYKFPVLTKQAIVDTWTRAPTSAAIHMALNCLN